MGVGLIGFHGNQERLLVLGATSGFAAVAFTAKVGVVELDETFEFSAVFPPNHGLHDLVLEPPSGAIAHPQMTGELQCGQVGPGRGEQVNRQEPGRQRQPGRFKQCAADQGGLMLTGPALIEDLPASPEARSAPIFACRAAKPLRPTWPIQCPAALGFGAVETDELGHRQTRLRCFSTAVGWSTGWGSWPWRSASGGNRGQSAPSTAQITRLWTEVRR